MNNSIYEVIKEKTSIKGFWQDDKGKIYIDNIKLYYPKNNIDFEDKVYSLFIQGEKSVFTRGQNKAFILTMAEDSIILENNFQLVRDKLSFNEIKNLLSIYNGLTIFKIGQCFIIDIWKN